MKNLFPTIHTVPEAYEPLVTVRPKEEFKKVSYRHQLGGVVGYRKKGGFIGTADNDGVDKTALKKYMARRANMRYRKVSYDWLYWKLNKPDGARNPRQVPVGRERREN